jgi:hypothetical protein
MVVVPTLKLQTRLFKQYDMQCWNHPLQLASTKTEKGTQQKQADKIIRVSVGTSQPAPCKDANALQCTTQT